ncbi:MAG: rhodanese-like domain-containing protein [Anaerolineales bacterium]
MNRRKKEYHRRRTTERRSRPVLMRPAVQIGILLVVALIIYIILQSGGGSGTASLPAAISVEEAYSKYQSGAFVLDVRTQEEWNEFHAPNTTLIPLDQLQARLSEVPTDKEIVVVCRSGNRSQQGRDILLAAGYKQVTSMTGGLNQWRSKGYPIEP